MKKLKTILNLKNNNKTTKILKNLIVTIVILFNKMMIKLIFKEIKK